MSGSASCTRRTHSRRVDARRNPTSSSAQSARWSALRCPMVLRRASVVESPRLAPRLAVPPRQRLGPAGGSAWAMVRPLVFQTKRESPRTYVRIGHDVWLTTTPDTLRSGAPYDTTGCRNDSTRPSRERGAPRRTRDDDADHDAERLSSCSSVGCARRWSSVWRHGSTSRVADARRHGPDVEAVAESIRAALAARRQAAARRPARAAYEACGGEGGPRRWPWRAPRSSSSKRTCSCTTTGWTATTCAAGARAFPR